MAAFECNIDQRGIIYSSRFILSNDRKIRRYEQGSLFKYRYAYLISSFTRDDIPSEPFPAKKVMLTAMIILEVSMMVLDPFGPRIT